jgi:hypothetical protein
MTEEIYFRLLSGLLRPPKLMGSWAGAKFGPKKKTAAALSVGSARAFN